MIASDIIYEDEIIIIMEQEQNQVRDQNKDKKENTISEKEKQKIMKEIEKKTEKTIKKAIQTNQLVDPIDLFTNKKKIDAKEIEKTESILQNIMKNGSEEFQQQTGRQMSYGEMRAMYG